MAKTTTPKTVKTTGQVFPDGSLLELVRPNSGAEELSLLRWDGENATIGKQFTAFGRIYRPASLNRAHMSVLRLPAHGALYGTTRNLFDGICKLIMEYADVAENGAWQIAYFVIASFLTERLVTAPFLCLTAPAGSPRTQLLRLLACLCRRTLRLVDVTPAALVRLESLQPTFVLDEPNLSTRAQRLLYASNSGGSIALGNGRITVVSSAKVICSREPLRDPLLANQALQVALSPPTRQLPFLGEDICASIAAEFQAKLLQYRLENLGRVCTPDIDVSELAAPLQDVARTIASGIVDDKELQLGVVQFLRGRELDGHLDSSTELSSTVLEALLFCCHRGSSRVLCGELTDIINTIWEKRGEGRKTSPESVGWKLRALDLRTEPIDGAGKGIRFSEGIRLRIHSLANAYRVPSLPQSTREGCSSCRMISGKQ